MGGKAPGGPGALWSESRPRGDLGILPLMRTSCSEPLGGSHLPGAQQEGQPGLRSSAYSAMQSRLAPPVAPWVRDGPHGRWGAGLGSGARHHCAGLSPSAKLKSSDYSENFVTRAFFLQPRWGVGRCVVGRVAFVQRGGCTGDVPSASSAAVPPGPTVEDPGRGAPWEVGLQV